MTNRQILAEYKRELRLAQRQYAKASSEIQKRALSEYIENLQMSIDDLTGAIAMGADDANALWNYSI